MFIDTHIHESKYSLDSHVSLAEIVDRARKIGLDGICITDHDDNRIRHEARALSQALGYLIIPGCEVLTYEGDIVVFGVDVLPAEKVHATELISYVNCKGGVGISAHPFRNNNRGLGEGIRSLPGLAGVEGLNGNTDLASNLQACRLAGELGLPIFGASDAHHVHEVGKYATYFSRKILNEADFIGAIKAGVTRAAIDLGDGFTLLDYVRK
ncbi:PHP domain protein [Sporomusa ovata DSM 2662]|uniref:Polymerase/histidinol phosphatase N-terminal domain-containing protein n=1 Tax=Sporomusa ovata TaxID=2378 RepID=A0A0U1KWA8_9FIRM|nr:PHP domain-containing protein [Sporomusa ovata]EQB28193.1 PHP domain-containing protein [Sporomusa ovata DSM 2662]CQR71730.1 hypothetical protein SpAn4DRAFT_3596 [Sporomusa ovata]